VHHCWQRELGQREVRALRDIEAGEELCISYANLYQTQEERKPDLLSRYGFECFCEACQREGEAMQKSEVNRAGLKELDRVLPMMLQLDDLDEVMGDVDELVEKGESLIDEELEAHAEMKCRLYFDAFQLALVGGDLDRASAWMRQAEVHSAVSHGPTSAQTLRFARYAESPMQYLDDLDDGAA